LRHQSVGRGRVLNHAIEPEELSRPLACARRKLCRERRIPCQTDDLLCQQVRPVGGHKYAGVSDDLGQTADL
jgi:hypothetical protein